MGIGPAAVTAGAEVRGAREDLRWCVQGPCYTWQEDYSPLIASRLLVSTHDVQTAKRCLGSMHLRLTAGKQAL